MKLWLYIRWIRLKAKYLFWTKLYKQHHLELSIMKGQHEHLTYWVKEWGSHKDTMKVEDK